MFHTKKLSRRVFGASVLALAGSGGVALAQQAGAPTSQGAAGAAPAQLPVPGGAGGGRPARQLSKLIEGPDLGYKPVANPLPMPAGMAYGSTAGVQINSKGHIFVFMGVRPDQKLNNMAFGPMVEFDPDGRFVRAWGEALDVSSPHGFRIDSEDNFWLTDIGDHTVTKLNPKGELLFRIGTKGKAGVWDEASGSRTLSQPTDLVIARNGDIIIGQGHGGAGDPRVLKFDKNGKYIASWSGKTEGPAAFADVHTVIFAPDGNLWVGYRSAKRILVFTPDGKFVRGIQMPVYVCSFYIHEKTNQLYMTSGWDGQILKLDWNANILAATGSPGVGLNKYGESMGLAISSRDEIFVGDKINDVVQKLIRK